VRPLPKVPGPKVVSAFSTSTPRDRDRLCPAMKCVASLMLHDARERTDARCSISIASSWALTMRIARILVSSCSGQFRQLQSRHLTPAWRSLADILLISRNYGAIEDGAFRSFRLKHGPQTLYLITPAHCIPDTNPIARL
jgi:hypothetical protein